MEGVRTVESVWVSAKSSQIKLQLYNEDRISSFVCTFVTVQSSDKARKIERARSSFASSKYLLCLCNELEHLSEKGSFSFVFDNFLTYENGPIISQNSDEIGGESGA